MQDKISLWLIEARRVTEAHKLEKTLIEWQICHIHSEASELYKALTRPPREIAQDAKAWQVFIVNEIWDIIHSAITAAHLLQISDFDLLMGLEANLRKIKERAGVK